MKNVLKIGRKMVLLGALLIAFGVVMYSDSFNPPVKAAPCCSSCEVSPFDGDEITYCENYCGASSGSCYNSCITRIHNCWRWCNFSC